MWNTPRKLLSERQDLASLFDQAKEKPLDQGVGLNLPEAKAPVALPVAQAATEVTPVAPSAGAAGIEASAGLTGGLLQQRAAAAAQKRAMEAAAMKNAFEIAERSEQVMSAGQRSALQGLVNSFRSALIGR